MSFHSAFFAMVVSQGLGLLAGAQLLLDPANTWISWPIVGGILGLAIFSTTKVVRFVDEVGRDLKDMEEVRIEMERLNELRREIEKIQQALDKYDSDEDSERMHAEIRTIQAQVLRLEAHERGVRAPGERGEAG
jgi:hypothetical protein